MTRISYPKTGNLIQVRRFLTAMSNPPSLPKSISWNRATQAKHSQRQADYAVIVSSFRCAEYLVAAARYSFLEAAQFIIKLANVRERNVGVLHRNDERVYQLHLGEIGADVIG